MFDNFFRGIFNDNLIPTISIIDFSLCITVTLIVGIFLGLVYIYKSRYTKSFVVTLSLLPAVVCIVIMMVNGNLGAGVAVAGAFSLVRFRSVPGTAKEIGAIFISMGTGLIAGMGYLAYSALFAIILASVTLLYQKLNFGVSKSIMLDKTLRIEMPENLDYSNVFDDLFNEYTTVYEIISVKTTNMGSLFKLTYNITLKNLSLEKEFIDALRCRNGNLEISISRQEVNTYEL